MRKALPGESPNDCLNPIAPPSVRPQSPVNIVAAVPAAAAARRSGIQGPADIDHSTRAPRHRRGRPRQCVCQASAAGGENTSGEHPAFTSSGLSAREVPQDSGESLETGGGSRLHDQQTTCRRCNGVTRGEPNSGLNVAQNESNCGLSSGRATWSLQRAIDAGMAGWGGRGGWLKMLRRRSRSTSFSG